METRMLNVVRTIGFILRHPLTKRQPLVAMFRWLRWQLGSRLLGTRVAIRWVDQTRLLVGKGDVGLTGNVYCGLHDFEEMAFVAHLLTADDLFVDIGANAGSYTILASGVKGCRVISVEPVPSTFQRLLDNINLNRLSDRVIPHNIAVGPPDRWLRFSTSLDTVNHVAHSWEREASIEMVPSKSLDQITETFRPTLLKVDVEGYEMEVLSGGTSTLGTTSLLAVIVELNGSGEVYGFSNSDVHQKLLEFGFTPCRYFPETRVLSRIDALEQRVGKNAIYIRDIESARLRLVSAKAISVLGFNF